MSRLEMDEDGPRTQGDEPISAHMPSRRLFPKVDTRLLRYMFALSERSENREKTESVGVLVRSYTNRTVYIPKNQKVAANRVAKLLKILDSIHKICGDNNGDAIALVELVSKNKREAALIKAEEIVDRMCDAVLQEYVPSLRDLLDYVPLKHRCGLPDAYEIIYGGASNADGDHIFSSTAGNEDSRKKSVKKSKKKGRKKSKKKEKKESGKVGGSTRSVKKSRTT